MTKNQRALQLVAGRVTSKLGRLGVSCQRLMLTSCGSRGGSCGWIEFNSGVTGGQFFQLGTPPKFNIAPEKLPSQKESSLPTIIFSDYVKLPGSKLKVIAF